MAAPNGLRTLPEVREIPRSQDRVLAFAALFEWLLRSMTSEKVLLLRPHLFLLTKVHMAKLRGCGNVGFAIYVRNDLAHAGGKTNSTDWREAAEIFDRAILKTSQFASPDVSAAALGQQGTTDQPHRSAPIPTLPQSVGDETRSKWNHKPHPDSREPERRSPSAQNTPSGVRARPAFGQAIFRAMFGLVLIVGCGTVLFIVLRQVLPWLAGAHGSAEAPHTPPANGYSVSATTRDRQSVAVTAIIDGVTTRVAEPDIPRYVTWSFNRPHDILWLMCAKPYEPKNASSSTGNQPLFLEGVGASIGLSDGSANNITVTCGSR